MSTSAEILDALWDVAKTAERWRIRKGHQDWHDCDLCNALRTLRLIEGSTEEPR